MASSNSLSARDVTEVRKQVCRRMSEGLNRADADDITQDILLEAHRAHVRIGLPYRQLTNAGVCRARHYNRQRRLAHDRTDEFDVDEYDAGVLDAPAVLQKSAALPQRPGVRRGCSANADPELTVLLIDALDQLAPVSRLAFLMVRYHGFPLADVASTLGVSISTVERLVRKAGAQLREYLS